ncbi:CHD5-like protein [Gossypium australe]|uniref:CHD5-like protein n=1 Tax=Gossypium australe TaxID=47621 RepID=A0A5B6WAZ9_9ROSI|nr:CHD5-like protein [Gossypium australe]
MEGEIMGEGEILGGGEMPGGGEILERTRSLAAPFVFFIIIAFQFAAKRLQDLKRGASKTDKEMQLRAEIKQLLKEAASYSQPSTFAQAAKLRRMAAAKEKELANCEATFGFSLCVVRMQHLISDQAHLTQEMKLSYDLYLKVLFIVKVFLCVYRLLEQVIAHVVIILWFWSSPVAYVSQHLVQPFGNAR